MVNFCSNCGAPTNPSDKFCMNCGNRLTFESIPSQTDKTKQEELLSTEDEKAYVAMGLRK